VTPAGRARVDPGDCEKETERARGRKREATG